MGITYSTLIVKDEQVNATGIPVPPEVVEALGSGKRPKVTVTLNGYTYRTSVAPYEGVYMLPLAAEHRNAAGVQPGQRIDVTLELDTEPRMVEVPDDLAAALAAVPGARERFDKLAYSHRKEHVRSVNDAKQPATRERRIVAVVAACTP
ncbi:MAG: YdeI/OmpD-associated family protein [Anaerolineae bacterium]